MNHRFISFTLCLLMAVTTLPLCAADAEKSSQDKQPAITEIGLSVSYIGDSDIQSRQWEQFTLRSDGTATKIIIGGAAHEMTEQPGSYKATLSQLDFKRLTELLKAQRFFEMKKRYPIDYPVFDITTHIIEGGERKKVVTDGWQAPVEMWNIQMAICGVASTLKWINDDTKSTDAAPAQPK